MFFDTAGPDIHPRRRRQSARGHPSAEPPLETTSRSRAARGSIAGPSRRNWARANRTWLRACAVPDLSPHEHFEAGSPAAARLWYG